MTRNSSRLTQVFATLGQGAPEALSIDGGRYSLRVVNDLASRRKAYGLVYRLYLEKEYARPNAARMWLSIHDALPETITLLVERMSDGAAVGALTVVFDSPFGLPADGLYRPELDELRASGRRLAEVISLGVDEGAESSRQVLVALFNHGYFAARGLRGTTDFVITVNPRHVRFYERMMLFAAAGPEREYGKVGGAPAVLLRLEFDRVEAERRKLLADPAARSILSAFRSVEEAPESVSELERQARPMSEAEFLTLMVEETDTLASATPAQRAWLAGRYPCCAAV